MNIKRITAPKSWYIKRKEGTWVSKISPGTHSKIISIPLVIALRDVLKLVKTSNEAKKIIKTAGILIDGRIVKNPNFPLGLMDVLSIPKIKKNYRVSIDWKGRVILNEINSDEADLKICMISNKIAVKDGKIHLGLHDGRSILLPKTKAKNYAVQSSLLLKIPSQEIVKSIPFNKGSHVLVIRGEHAGETAVIESFHKFKGSQSDLVVLKNSDNLVYETLQDYAIAVGEKKPEVKI